MHINHAFRPMVELESALGELYASWSTRFASDQEAAKLFFRLSREEKAHVSLIEYQQRVFAQNRQLSAEVDIDPATLQEAIDEVRRIRSAPRRPTVAEAILIAISMESSAAETHYKEALKKASSEIENLLNRLGGDDAAHLLRLKEFARKRGIQLPPEESDSEA